MTDRWAPGTSPSGSTTGGPDVTLLMEGGTRPREDPPLGQGQGAGLWPWQGVGSIPACSTSAAGPRWPHLGPGPQESPLWG